MSKPRRTRSQAQKDLRALRRLRDLGIISSKIDLRKAPTRYTRRYINKIMPVIEGKAAAVKPLEPQKYKSAGFATIKNVVIVPKKKGERISVGLSGKIKKARREGRRKITSTIRTEQPSKIERPAANKIIIFKVPFNRKDGGVDYRRFTYDGLKLFFAEYLRNIKQFDEWAQYIEEEEIEFDSRESAEAYEDARNQTITGYVSEREDARPIKDRRKVRKLRRELKQELSPE